MELDIKDQASKKNTIALLSKLAKCIPNDERLDMLEQLRILPGAKIPTNMGSDMNLNWDEVREMSDCGIEFGAHSVTHPILANVSEVEAMQEIFESKKAIENFTRKEVIVFSYPVGGEDRFDKTTKDIVKETGYSYAVSYIHGVNTIPGLDRFSLKRIHVEKEDTFPVFKCKILMPGIVKY